eukprot:TRINITY_DN52248_c0_g1_i1.p1 TRINITY_DN52248_c0_g1~~TRINITY_DN52248_c0_g1_i1.p1  ORF type:complete len:468 (+),score=52.37 TRINITY_DN52248_c0_g1_i1:60-1463(+)
MLTPSSNCVHLVVVARPPEILQFALRLQRSPQRGCFASASITLYLTASISSGRIVAGGPRKFHRRRSASMASATRPPPRSCDTLVILPDAGSGLSVCFGKNSDRPSDEEHEVLWVPRQQHPEGSVAKCTYFEIPQARETLRAILSKPRWLWGCEMGANECGVVGGNEAVSTCAVTELGSQQRLLGMDLLRLALERGRTAREAVEVCASFLENYGQGGGCAEGSTWTYENGFLFADTSEAFVLETAGVSWWAVEKIPVGAFRNISNGISIRTNIHSMHSGLQQHCLDKGWWDGREPFDFKHVLTGGGTAHSELQLCGRERAGHDFLSQLHADIRSGQLSSETALAQRMIAILRDEDSGICFRDLHGFNSTGSQVSLLGPDHAEHFFTCSSDPKLAAYKRFNFDEAGAVSAEVICSLSLELWRRHRTWALRRGAPKELRQIEDSSWPSSHGAHASIIWEQLQKELNLFK